LEGGGAFDEESLIITRRVSTSGRSGATVGGLPVTIATLQKLGSRLVEIHGQFEGRALLDPDQQRELLDDYGGLVERVASYQAARLAHATLRRKRQELIDSSEARQRERALLEFERDELASAAPLRGESDELTREAHRLAHAGQLRAAAAEGYALLYEEDRSAQGLLTRVARALVPLARAAPELAEAAATLERLAGEAQEVAFSLRELARGWEDDPSRLDEIEARLAQYRRLSARFHCTADELVDRRAATEAQLAALDRDDADLRALDQPLAAAWTALVRAAAQLTAARRKAAKELARAIQVRLKSLSLEAARLAVAVEPIELGDDPTAPSPAESGADRVEILFTATAGDEPRPLRKIASGGELSRVTLAAKAALAAADRVPTLVFDEIDTGIGGRLGAALGRTLAELGRHHQVICVTHLPQMASYAQRQWVIRKELERGRPRTTIVSLDEAERIEELATMLRGDSAAEGTRQEALAMLAEARANAVPP
jgi:DNA repair protein RecN (Recombination protein N)